MVTASESYVRQLTENRYLGLPDNFEVADSKNMLLACRPDEEFPIDLVWLLSQPENFGLTCKVLFNVELAPFQVFILQELWQRKFPMLIGCRGMGKSFILGLYACLRAVLTPNSRIVLVGAAFRQSKLLFEYMEAIWRNAPVFQYLIGSGNGAGPKRTPDRCTFYIRDSQVIAIPIGTGERIRGLRANYTIADEFSSISPEIFEVVIRGLPGSRDEKVSQLIDPLAATNRDSGLLRSRVPNSVASYCHSTAQAKPDVGTSEAITHG